MLESSGGYINAELEPGQASFHHWKCVHSSGANLSEFHRIGYILLFIDIPSFTQIHYN